MLTEKRKQLLDDTSPMAKNAADYMGNVESDEKGYEKIKDLIQKHIQEILVGKFEEDIYLTEKETKKLPHRIKHYMYYSECRGIKYYVLSMHNLKYISVGAFGSSALRDNEKVFDKLITDPAIQPIVHTTTFQLSELLGAQGKRIKWKQGMQKKWRKLIK